MVYSDQHWSGSTGRALDEQVGGGAPVPLGQLLPVPVLPLGERKGGEMSIYSLIPILAGVALLGWVAGMWTHKRAERWCMACGSHLICVQCRPQDRVESVQVTH